MWLILQRAHDLVDYNTEYIVSSSNSCYFSVEERILDLTFINLEDETIEVSVRSKNKIQTLIATKKTLSKHFTIIPKQVNMLITAKIKGTPKIIPVNESSAYYLQFNERSKQPLFYLGGNGKYG